MFCHQHLQEVKTAERERERVFVLLDSTNL